MTTRCRFQIPATTWAYLMILAVVVIGAVMREINLLIILAGLMAGPLLISWQLIRTSLRGVEVHRRLPRGVFPGQLFQVELLVKNPRDRLDAWAILVSDSIRRVGAVDKSRTAIDARAFVAHVPTQESRTVSYRARLEHRGRYRFGPLELQTQVPVGLLIGTVGVPAVNELLVYPRLGTLQRSMSQWIAQDKNGAQNWQRRHGAIEGDFFGLREWRSGDSRRWIHWRSSAKRNELVVRQYEEHRQQDLVVLLDLGRCPQDGDCPPRLERAIELAISFVATMAAEHCSRGGGGLLLGIAAAQSHVVRGAANASLRDDILELLADAAPTAADPLPGLLAESLSLTSMTDRVLIVAPQPMSLQDRDRFPRAAGDAMLANRLARAVCVDAGAASFAHDFVWDDGDAAADKPTVKNVQEVTR